MRILLKIIAILFALASGGGAALMLIFLFSDEYESTVFYHDTRDLLLLIPVALILSAIPSMVFNASTFYKHKYAVHSDENLLDLDITRDKTRRLSPSRWKLATWWFNLVLSLVMLGLGVLVIYKIADDWIEGNEAQTPTVAYVVGIGVVVISFIMLLDSIRWRRSTGRS